MSAPPHVVFNNCIDHLGAVVSQARSYHNETESLRVQLLPELTQLGDAALTPEQSRLAHGVDTDERPLSQQRHQGRHTDAAPAYADCCAQSEKLLAAMDAHIANTQQLRKQLASSIGQLETIIPEPASK